MRAWRGKLGQRAGRAAVGTHADARIWRPSGAHEEMVVGFWPNSEVRRSPTPLPRRTSAPGLGRFVAKPARLSPDRRADRRSQSMGNKKAPLQVLGAFSPRRVRTGSAFLIRFGLAGCRPATTTFHLGRMIVSLTYLRCSMACLSQDLNYRAADGWVNPNPAFPSCDQAALADPLLPLDRKRVRRLLPKASVRLPPAAPFERACHCV